MAPLLQLRPDRHETDGFFAAVFERKGGAADCDGVSGSGGRRRAQG